MRDEDFELFIEEFGEASLRREVAAQTIAQWRGKLPEQLLTYWQEEGWAAYGDGLFWTVNPADYEDVVDAWLAGTPFAEADTFHAIARSAFGDLYLCGEKTGPCVTLACALTSIIALQKEVRPKDAEELNLEIRIFFSGASPSGSDLKDIHRKPLFTRALKTLGPLSDTEMYGFEPALPVGGSLELETLRKVEAHPHLMILRELSPPAMPFDDPDLDRLMG